MVFGEREFVLRGFMKNLMISAAEGLRPLSNLLTKPNRSALSIAEIANMLQALLLSFKFCVTHVPAK
jgi:hypothetical protein